MSLRGRTDTGVRVSSTTRFLVVTCAETYFALHADIVRGLMTPEEAGSGEAVTAVGVTYPLRDLAGRFGLPEVSSAPESRIILCTLGNFHKGFRVNQVLGLTDVEKERLRPLPPHFSGPEQKWFAGLFLFGETIALHVNSSWLLGEETGPAQLPKSSVTTVTALASSHAAAVGIGMSPRPPFETLELEEAPPDADDTPWAQL
ncbi:MAG TPA: chemotaxis protein CheW [Nitrospiraceae bacterium]|nr:chemotaxis protein CheW [Nitrospiraceae bacterium]